MITRALTLTLEPNFLGHASRLCSLAECSSHIFLFCINFLIGRRQKEKATIFLLSKTCLMFREKRVEKIFAFIPNQSQSILYAVLLI